MQFAKADRLHGPWSMEQPDGMEKVLWFEAAMPTMEAWLQECGLGENEK